MTRAPRYSVSVIVRTFNSAGQLAGCIASIRRQSLATEVVVVDSGSIDDTVTLARTVGDTLVQLTSYSPGKALNAGASRANGDFHIALSSHVALPDSDWVVRCVSHFDAPNVAAASGQLVDSRNCRLSSPIVQTLSDLRLNPNWGYSNTAGAWRASVWLEHRFNEDLAACEDKEWAARVLAAGWGVVVDPSLVVDDKHRRGRGLRNYAARLASEHKSLVEAGLAPPWRISDLVRGWLDTSGERLRARQLISPDRNLSLLMRYLATRSLKP